MECVQPGPFMFSKDLFAGTYARRQNYFRETSCIPLLAPLLLFPQPTALTPASLSGFAFQSWSEQKVINAGLVILLVRMLVGGAGTGRAGNQKALLTSGLTRCLFELALASNAPAVLKSQVNSLSALFHLVLLLTTLLQSLNCLADIVRLSPLNQEFLANLNVAPLIPPQSPSAGQSDQHAYGSNNEESTSQAGQYSEGGGRESDQIENKWRRGEEMAAIVALTNLAVHGDGTRGRDGLRVRAAAVGLLEVSLRMMIDERLN